MCACVRVRACVRVCLSASLSILWFTVKEVLSAYITTCCALKQPSVVPNLVLSGFFLFFSFFFFFVSFRFLFVVVCIYVLLCLSFTVAISLSSHVKPLGMFF